MAEVRDHGGSLTRAEALFPGAPKPWIDCSTGINPHPYPVSHLPASAWQRLPEPDAIGRLRAAAARAYGAPDAANVAAAPGTQILLPRVFALMRPGRVTVLGPTYAEHSRCAALAGHAVTTVEDFAALAHADVAVVVNPNNPDGRLLASADLLALARELKTRGGLLVMDEAFMDVAPDGFGLSAEVETAGNIVVLRSFGKFFGLAGLRLGFAIASRAIATRLEAELGPWAVSGPAIQLGAAALDDLPWQAAMRGRLAAEAVRLDAVLAAAGVGAPSGTSLYRFLRLPDAQALFAALGRRGVYVRRFDAMPDALRIGLPPDEAAWTRLSKALLGLRDRASGAERRSVG